MKRYSILSSVILFVAFIFVVPARVFACPWYDPLCATPIPTFTPTPTPGLIHIIQPSLQKTFVPLVTLTPTPTPTATPTLTPTLTPTPSVGPTVSLTTTPEASVSPEITVTGSPTPTVEPQKTLVAGFTNKEVAYAGIAVLLLVVIVVQANWMKIKTWLHQKTS